MIEVDICIMYIYIHIYIHTNIRRYVANEGQCQDNFAVLFPPAVNHLGTINCYNKGIYMYHIYNIYTHAHTRVKMLWNSPSLRGFREEANI